MGYGILRPPPPPNGASLMSVQPSAFGRIMFRYHLMRNCSVVLPLRSSSNNPREDEVTKSDAASEQILFEEAITTQKHQAASFGKCLFGGG